MRLFTTTVATASAALLLQLALPTGVQAQSDADCLTALGKSAAKLGDALAKEFAGCIKSAGKGKLPGGQTAAECILADSKGKVAKARGKVVKAQAKSCATRPAFGFASASKVNAAVPDDFVPVADWFGVDLDGAILSDADGAKCQAALAKAGAKILSTKLNEFQGCLKDGLSDGSITGEEGLAVCADSLAIDDKVAKAVAKLQSAAGKKCAATPVAVALPGTCAAEPLASLAECLDASLECAVCHAIVSAGDLDSGCDLFDDGLANGSCPIVCPTQTTFTVKAGTDPDGPDPVRTRRETGWSGTGHAQNLVGGSTLSVEIDCAAATPDSCGVCDVTGIGAGAAAEYPFRCANAFEIACDEPFGPDSDCPSGDCVALLSPPEPTRLGDVPYCRMSFLTQNPTGSVDLVTGAADLALEAQHRLYLGGTGAEPCPVCVGDAAANDGVRGGACHGSAGGYPLEGAPCDTAGDDAVWGPVSADCPPRADANISGVGSRAPITLTTGTASITAQLPCHSPLNFLNCPCAVCSGNVEIPCDTDDVCIDAAAGTCTSTGLGVNTQPNDCNDLTCTDGGGGVGYCAAGPTDKFCDGYLGSNGIPLVGCTTDEHCTALNPICPGEDCGSCTLSRQRACFLDPIEATGIGDPSDPVLVGVGCVAPTLSSGVNSIVGLPGPERLTLETSRSD